MQVHDSLKRIAVVSKGWEWVDGGKNMTGGHKWGWCVTRRRGRGGCQQGASALRWFVQELTRPLPPVPLLPRRESDKPGSKLTLRLASHVGDIPTTNVDLMLGLLHSWQGMGQVQVACTSGCR